MGDLLVLGGTRFSGARLVEMAAAAGDRVTVFCRGESAPARAVLELIESGRVERVVGDRDPRSGAGLAALESLVRGGRRFDAVVDFSGYVPRVVRASAELVRPIATRYVFISSISVYPFAEEGSPGEDAPVIELDDPAVEEVTGETYGGLKVLCERAVWDVFGSDATVVRPGLIVGADDMTDRFTYWVRRAAEGGAVLAPRDPAGRAGWIDARDLAAFVLRCARAGASGTFNACGPTDPIGIEAFVRAVGVALGSSWSLAWADPAWLAERGVRPWQDLPAWVPTETASMARASNRRALDAGLTLRPLAETVRDTDAWDAARGRPALVTGLARDRELVLIAQLGTCAG